LLPWLEQSHSVKRAGAVAFAIGFCAVNLFQTVAHQGAWRNGETLWQYHIALPQPSPSAFENLAAYYYAQVTEHPDPERMSTPLTKMSVVIEAGLNHFWEDRSQPPPPATAYLFFLKSLVQEVSGQPQLALESLLTSDRLKPGFDAT